MVKPTSPLVFVVDDDVHMREALRNLFESVGMGVEMFGSTSELLARLAKGTPECCLVLDIRLPVSVASTFRTSWRRLATTFRSSS